MKKWVAVLLTLSILIVMGSCTPRDSDTSDAAEASVSSSSDISTAESTVNSEENPEETSIISPGNPGATALSGKVLLEQPTMEEAAENNAKINDADIHLIQFDPLKEGDTIATMETSVGSIVLRLFPEQAPLAVENFVTHAENGYYNGMSFYKIMENFYIESGAPADSVPVSIFQNSEGHATPFVTEISTDLWNFRGALVMKNKGIDRPHTNTSEFRIIQSSVIGDDWFEKMEETNFPKKVITAYKEHGGIPGFDGRNTVLGHVIEGLDILDSIATATTDGSYSPEEPVSILSISVVLHDGKTQIYGSPLTSSSEDTAEESASADTSKITEGAK